MTTFRSFLAAAALALGVAALPAAILTVPAPHATIQDAVNAAGATGDEVHVTAAGTYTGTVDVNNKNLSIVGDVAGVIVAGTVTNQGTSVLTINNVTVQGAGFDGIVQSGSGDLTILNTIINSNPGRGILQNTSGNITVSTTTISNNGFDGYNRSGGSGGSFTITGGSQIFSNGRSGILVEGSTNAILSLTGVLVRNNNVGIWINSGSTAPSVTIAASTLRNNPQDQILVQQKCTLNISGTTVETTSAPGFNGGGIRYDGAAPAAGVTTSNITNCIFTCPFASKALWVLHKTDLTISGSTFTGFTSSIEVPDNTNALGTFNISTSTFSGTSSVPISINGTNGNPAHVLTADRIRVVGSGSTAFNLLNAVATEATIRNSVFDGGDRQIWSAGTQAFLKAYHCTLVGHTNTSVSLNFQDASASHEVVNCISDGAIAGLRGAAGVAVVNNHNLVRSSGPNFVTITPGASTLSNLDPRFVTASTGPGTGNFHLLSASPAINVGANTLGIVTDYDGTSRPLPVATVPDLGAFEETVSVPVELSSFGLE